MGQPDDPRLRLRLYIDGIVLDQVWIDTTSPTAQQQIDSTQRRHAALADKADARGERWMAEVYDPAAPADNAYLRFGTDPDGMIEPREVHTLDLPPGWPGL
jgi:hypothetical protein